MRRINLKADKTIKISKLAAAAGLSYETAMAALRKKDVRVNGLVVRTDMQLLAGDEVTLFVPERKLDVLFSDENILVINKPQGVSVAIADGGEDTLEHMARAEFGEAYACHRLDRNTGGLVLMARNQTALDAILHAFKTRLIEKRYECLAKGPIQQSWAEMKFYLLKTDQNVKVFDRPQPGAVESLTGYKVIEQAADIARLQVRLYTGRTHQIRAVLAHIGHPVLGDDKYGDRDFNKKYGVKMQALWAIQMTLHFPQESMLFYLDGRSFLVQVHFPKRALDVLEHLD